MRKERILLALGTWVAILPYLGFPYSWKDTFTFLTGLVIILFSYVLYRDNKKKEVKKEKVFDNFKDNSAEDVVRQQSGRTTSETEESRRPTSVDGINSPEVEHMEGNEEYKNAPPDDTI